MRLLDVCRTLFLATKGSVSAMTAHSSFTRFFYLLFASSCFHLGFYWILRNFLSLNFFFQFFLRKKANFCQIWSKIGHNFFFSAQILVIRSNCCFPVSLFSFSLFE